MGSRDQGYLGETIILLTSLPFTDEEDNSPAQVHEAVSGLGPRPALCPLQCAASLCEHLSNSWPRRGHTLERCA